MFYYSYSDSKSEIVMKPSSEAIKTKALRNKDDETRPPIQTPEQGPGFDNVNIGASPTSQTHGSSTGHEPEPVRDGHVLLDVGSDDALNVAQPMVATAVTIDETMPASPADTSRTYLIGLPLTSIEAEQGQEAVIIQEAPIIPSDEGRKAATEHTPGFLERFLPTVHSCRPCAPCGQAAPVEVTITSP